MRTKIAVILIAAVGLFGCQKQPEVSTHQGNFNVEKLFTHEGCTVYRFYDDRTVYYTNCQGQANTQYSCGKNCTTNTETTTSFPK